jgi:hypothetical protein
MVGWDKERIIHEVKRQLEWGVATITRMQKEKLAVEEANRKLLARRQSYKAKNNGRGRPPKALEVFSRERAGRLAQLKVETKLLIELMPQLAKAIDPLLPLETRLKEIPSFARDGVAWTQSEKLKGLLSQFRQRPSPLAKASLPWREQDVRHYFVLLAKVQKAKICALSKMTLQTPAEKLEDDRHHAVAQLLGNILYSNHLESPDRLCRAIEVWRHGPPSFAAQIETRWQQTWQEAVVAIWQDLANTFAGVS